LYQNSIAFRLMVDIEWYGNVAYRTLKIYPYPYESVKDTIQKLIRAGYIGVVKGKKSKTLRQSVKSLHITPEGRKALQELYDRLGRGRMKHEPVIYQKQKAYRANLVTTATMMIHKSTGAETFSCYEVKRYLEKANPRGSDFIKYSRFVVFWKRPSVCTVVYNFGGLNMLLNKNGERNARQAAHDYAEAGEVDMLILGDDSDTLRSILDYSLWFNQKLEKQRNHLKKVHYHINLKSNQDHGAMFLPVHYEALAVMQLMQDENWAERIAELHQEYEEEDMAVWGLLDCKIKLWLTHRKHPNHTRQDKVLILCYDWQEALVKEFFREIADQKELWIQVLTGQLVSDLFFDKIDYLPYDPYRL